MSTADQLLGLLDGRQRTRSVAPVLPLDLVQV